MEDSREHRYSEHTFTDGANSVSQSVMIWWSRGWYRYIDPSIAITFSGRFMWFSRTAEPKKKNRFHIEPNWFTRRRVFLTLGIHPPSLTIKKILFHLESAYVIRILLLEQISKQTLYTNALIKWIDGSQSKRYISLRIRPSMLWSTALFLSIGQSLWASQSVHELVSREGTHMSWPAEQLWSTERNRDIAGWQCHPL